jgi:hypothetical protein
LGGYLIVLLNRTATRDRQFRLYVPKQNDVSPRSIRIGNSPDGLVSWLDRIKAWLDENCGANGWGLKKAALEQSASDAARPLAWVRETYEPSPSR